VLSKTNEIGGVRIIAVNKIKIFVTPESDPGPNTNNPDDSNISSNILAIILGVTIPGVIIIVLIIEGCWIKKRSQ
jgi:hypothetical protein